MLSQSSLAPLTPSISALKKLHPGASAPVPPLPPDAPPLHVDPDVIKLHLRNRLTNGAHSGPSGWTGELLQALSADNDCLLGLSYIIEDILNGNPPPASRDLLLASSLLPASKSSSTSTLVHDVRPIAMGECLVKLAAHYASILSAPNYLHFYRPFSLASLLVPPNVHFYLLNLPSNSPHPLTQ